MKAIIFLAFVFVLTQSANAQILLSKGKINREPYYQYKIIRSQNDTVIFYLSESNWQDKLPLVVFVQGSGTQALFRKEGDKVIPDYGHITLAELAPERMKVLIVEKPGITHWNNGKNDTTVNKTFNERFDLSTWSGYIESAIKFVLSHDSIDDRKVMLIGHSEGGLTAARVAHDMPETITNIAILAGEGTTQLYSLYAFARSGEFFNNSLAFNSEQDRIDSLTKTWQAIIKYPNDTKKMFWGFTYRRWYSFLSTSVLDELGNFKGKIFIVQGLSDKNVYPESSVILYTGLLSKGKDVVLSLIKNADHSFNNVSNYNSDGWSKILKQILMWFSN